MQMVRLLLVMVVDLPVSLRQVSGGCLFLVQEVRLLLLVWSDNEPYTGEWDASLR